MSSKGNRRVHSAGKGDSPRKIDMEKYRENYNKIFGKKIKPNLKGKKNSS